MAEADFEEDLFADLYAEDGAAPNPTTTVNEVKLAKAVSSEMKEDGPIEQPDEKVDADQVIFKDDDDIDDDIDFNLGNGTSYEAPAPHDAHGPGIKEDG